MARVSINVMVRVGTTSTRQPTVGSGCRGPPTVWGMQLAIGEPAVLCCAQVQPTSTVLHCTPRHRKERAHPVVGPRSRSRLVVLGGEVSGRGRNRPWPTDFGQTNFGQLRF